MKKILTTLAVLVAAGGVAVVLAADAPAKKETPATRPSADQVMKDMTGSLEKNAAIEPTQRPPGSTNKAAGEKSAAPSFRPEVDAAVIGTAPGLKQPKLRREGEMIVNRRGRLARGAGGGQVLFVFDADSQQTQEAPVVLLPCQVLQNMEDLVQERGERIAFSVSGQVFTYRGGNYMLPTTMTIEFDKGNLGR